MANTYHQIYLQIVFAVKYRKAMLDKTWRSTVCGVIGNLVNETGCKTLIVNGVDDHLHCLVGLRPVISVSDLLKVVKAKSSKYINEQNLTPCRFEWQDGYGAFSYAQTQLDEVYRYVKNQEAHHHELTFRKEYINLLDEFGITYDTQCIFKEPA